MLFRLIAFFLAVAACAGSLSVPVESRAEDGTYRIGVLARRGIDSCLRNWTPTAQYLNEMIPEARFVIVPMTFEETVPAVESRQVDFLVANSSIYLELQAKFGISRMVTQKNTTQEHGTFFGGVIFCHSDRKDIRDLEDLKGKSFAGVDPTSLGGWIAAWREFKAKGIDPGRHFSTLSFPGTHDAVVHAVKAGLVAAGTVATSILELMQEENEIDLRDFKILNQQVHSDFPFMHSTRLYPAWPLSRLKHTPEMLAEKVTVALLNMPPDSPAAQASNCAGWTVPPDYSSVDECLRELGIGPYADLPKASLLQVLSFYRTWIMAGVAGLTVLLVLLLYISTLNRHLQTSKKVLELEVAERVIAAQALKESQRRLSTLMSNLPGMAYRCAIDPQWTMIFLSEGCLQITGYRPEVFIDNAMMAYSDIVLPEDRAGLQDVILKAVEVGRPFHTTYRIKTAEGEVKWLFEQGRAVFSESGNVSVLEGFIQDVSEHRKTVDALVASEVKFRTMIESIPVGIHLFELQTDGTLTYQGANPAADRMLEVDSSGLVGRDVLEVWPGLAGSGTLDAFRRTAMDGEPWYNDHLRYEDGRIAGDFSVHAVRTSPKRIAVSFQNITDRKKAEDALRSSEEKFRSLIENGLDIITIISVDGTIRYISPSIERVMGYRVGDLIGLNCFDLIHPDDRLKNRRLFLGLCGRPGELGFSEYRVRHKNRSWRTLEGVAKNALNDPGISGVVLNSRDITDRKMLEERLRQSQKMEAVGTLAGGIAHDFNNILAAIIGYTELSLLPNQPANAVRNCLEQVLKAAFRARDVVKQILVFTRARDEEGLQPLRVGPIVEEGLKLLRASLPVTIDIRADLDCQRDLALADATQLHQILINLCTNAAHAMEQDGGILGVTLRAANPEELADNLPPDSVWDPYLVLTVSDTGCGMDRSTVERIFDPYFTTKEVGKGTGLGLAVVHGIVERHRGWIKVLSEPGMGSTFKVFIPGLRTQSVKHTASDEHVAGGTERILFVDDEPSLVDVAQTILESLGYEVTAMTNGAEALELFMVDPMRFDAIVTDFTMPQITGAELAREILQRRPDIPVILCTGFTERMDDVKAKDMGISEFVMKPLDLKTLARLIRKHLDRQTARRQ
ncbi:MAG: PAS domain S-box protein [Syntrophobacteraceae bacterium]|nr:PAS domain S-box protein [Desulfobacteraceae bacterium]